MGDACRTGEVAVRSAFQAYVSCCPQPPVTGDDGDTPAVPAPPQPPVKKRKSVSIKTINNASTWQIETEDDVKKYVSELEKRLIATLEDNTVINIEF